MNNHSIEAIELQIASEIKMAKDGKAIFSYRAIERIINVSNATINKHFLPANTNAEISTSKLAQTLINKGFQVQTFSKTGVPDAAVATIIEYYAFDAGKRCTPEALLAFRSFAAIGIRFWAQKITGWIPETKPNVDPQVAFKECLQKQLPEQPSQWECRYPKLFWQELERLYGLKRGDKGCAAIIYNYIYCKFPECVRERLDEINPLIEGGRKHKLHQNFDHEMLSFLITTIEKVTTLMEGAETKEDFKKSVKRVPHLKLNINVVQRFLNASNE